MRVRIHGRVQGVGFRDWTQGRAHMLGLEGWVRNLRDGCVEALFVGPPDKVERMLADCHRGPPLAEVETVEAADDEDEATAAAGLGFQVRYSA